MRRGAALPGPTVTSRNDPCPCGSGAKYKRCCLAKDDAETRRAAAEERAALPALAEPTEEDLAIEDELDADATLAAAVDRPFDEDVAPWELACFAEGHPIFAKARARDAAWAATPSLPGELEALSDDDLRARLDRLGVTGSPDAFRAAARAARERGQPSGWAVAAAWRTEKLAGRALTRAERDFLGLAACELWRRLLPEEPSREMLEDEIEAGRALLDEGRAGEAFEVWEDVLDVVVARLAPRGKTLADSPRAGDPVILGEWLEDWLDELHALAHDDPDAALAGLELVETILEKLPDQGGPGGGTMRVARSAFLLAQGRDEEAVAEARRLRDAHPDSALGSIALADALVFEAERDPERLEEALAVLSAARSRSLSDAKTWKLDERYDELLKLLRRARAGS